MRLLLFVEVSRYRTDCHTTHTISTHTTSHKPPKSNGNLLPAIPAKRRPLPPPHGNGHSKRESFDLPAPKPTDYLPTLFRGRMMKSSRRPWKPQICIRTSHTNWAQFFGISFDDFMKKKMANSSPTGSPMNSTRPILWVGIQFDFSSHWDSQTLVGRTEPPKHTAIKIAHQNSATWISKREKKRRVTHSLLSVRKISRLPLCSWMTAIKGLRNFGILHCWITFAPTLVTNHKEHTQTHAHSSATRRPRRTRAARNGSPTLARTRPHNLNWKATGTWAPSRSKIQRHMIARPYAAHGGCAQAHRPETVVVTARVWSGDE